MSGVAAALAPDLAAAVAAIEIASARRYRVGGRARELDRADGAAALTAALAVDVYEELFVRPRSDGWAPADGAGNAAFVAALRRAQPSGGTWEPGWRVVAPDAAGDEVAVARHGVVFRARRDAVRAAAGELAPGAVCRVWTPAERLRLAPGFYVVFGTAEAPETAPPWDLRLYWNLRPEGAARWLELLVRALDAAAIPFTAKLPARPRDYRRADAAVVYLDPGDWAAAGAPVGELYRATRTDLEDATPLWTAALGPGLGIAEGPAGGASFGRHRSELVARGCAAVLGDGGWGRGAAEEEVARQFAAAGLDPQRPHLAPGSRSTYPALAPSAAASPHRRARAPEPAPSDFLAAAAAVGERLCREAWWEGGRANWLGRRDRAAGAGRARSVLAALEGDLYAGSAGVGLFLAALAAHTGDAAHRETACGALRQALAIAAREPQRYPPLALFAGRLGIAWAARETASLTGDGELATAAREALGAVLEAPPEDGLLDLVRGSAGAIPLLCALHREDGEARALALATALGERMVAAGEEERAGWTWPNERLSGAVPGVPTLAGLAHGASGVGLALLELAAATGCAQARAAGRGALAYEDGREDPASGRWPDFRRTGSEGAPALVAGGWCHGAPGIALARRRAAALDPERAPTYLATAERALAVTREALARAARDPGADASLCHGVSGLAEIAALAGEGTAGAGLRRAAAEALGQLAARRLAGGEWPSGVAAGARNPSLFLGDAGVGWALLAQARPRAIASPLLPWVRPHRSPR